MDECELLTLITAIACTISKNCTEDDISLLSVVFTQLGDSLATILTKRELCEKNSNNTIRNLDKNGSNNNNNNNCTNHNSNQSNNYDHSNNLLS